MTWDSTWFMAVWSLREIFGQNSGKKIEGQEKAEKSRLHASFDFFIFSPLKKRVEWRADRTYFHTLMCTEQHPIAELTRKEQA